MTNTDTLHPLTPDKSPKRRRRWFGAIVALVAIVLVGLFALPRLRPYAFHGTVIRSSEPAPDVPLQSANGPVTLDAFQGELTVLYFGYMYCPDVCTTTLAKLARAVELLEDRAEEVNVVMISVDPERDTPAELADYVAHFDPDFIGVTGDPATIDRVATLYGVYYERSGGSGSDYLIDHTATTLVVDREGRLKLILPFDTSPEEIAEDLRYLLDH